MPGSRCEVRGASKCPPTTFRSMSEKRVIVTAHRDWDDFDTLVWSLAELKKESVGPVCIVHGGSTTDRAFAKRAICAYGHLGWREEVHRPDYTKYPGKVAPPVRNSEMVAAGAELCLAFYDGRRGGGTVDTMKKARRAGIEVRVREPGYAERASATRTASARTRD